ncbi:hypothetical protein EJ04DRAFT_511325 [Polyplosphaeria fusca]|uniref:Altered inheritance of mitochondria protein 6 n=1 Tax=Polyplosphaeria fusca TaxID=682080 RepID=A0A9P4R027_9PLEO|nr:hypothetical protein EJ04DRAFT_511325 [Polyplosphaeria fusca]
MTLVPVLLDDDASFLPKWGHPGYLGEGLASYPTDFTRDVIPIQCHSHNDYWRRVPLYEALHFGCVGVEADVWLFDNELFVGHNTMSLTKNRTFRSMYVDPLAKLLDQQNTGNEFSTPSSTRKHSVFDTSPNQTLVLLVDFKNDGHSIFPVVEEHLSALQEKGYLTYFDGENLVRGAITVVATGNAPFDLISANTTTASPRTIFFDAPLDRLSSSPSSSLSHQTPPPPHPRRDGQGTVGTTPTSTFSTANSYYASVSFASSIGRIWGARLSSTQLERIRSQIRSAHARGLKVRYWATPQWPVGLRNHVWDVLVKEGADYLNGDDLAGMTRVDWGVRKHGGWL